MGLQDYREAEQVCPSMLWSVVGVVVVAGCLEREWMDAVNGRRAAPRLRGTNRVDVVGLTVWLSVLWFRSVGGVRNAIQTWEAFLRVSRQNAAGLASAFWCYF